MKKLLLGALVLALAATGCAVTDYPVISDDRGSYSGVIRTGHKAYVVPTSQIATIWDDGSDELFSMVYQNQYGDQTLYTFNNFDYTASVLFLDQTYCDWRHDGCEIVRAWNPNNANIDDPFDYEFFPDCSGARSLSLLLSQSSRLAECGDKMLMADKQGLMGEFANLATTTWRGEVAYLLPINAENTSITFNGVSAPIYGQFTTFVTNDLDLVIPATPNLRHELRWLADYVAENGNEANVTLTYGSVSANLQMAFAPAGITHNLNRF
jgi:hypothetical protein